MITLHGIYFKKICQWKGINPLSPNIHLQILQTGLHRFPSRISWENLTKDQSILRGTLGGTQYHNNVRKIGKYQNTVSKIDEIPITHSDLFEGRGSCTQATFMIGHVYLKLYPYHVFVLSQAFMHQKPTSDIARKRHRTLISTTIEKPGHWMPFQFRHRLCNHLPLSLKS